MFLREFLFQSWDDTYLLYIAISELNIKEQMVRTLGEILYVNIMMEEVIPPTTQALSSGLAARFYSQKALHSKINPP